MKNRKGSTIVYSVIIAFIITFTTFIVALYFGSIKPRKVISITDVLYIDYQIESAIIKLLQEYKNNPKAEMKVIEKEIASNVNLTITPSKLDNNRYIFDVKATGKKLDKKSRVEGNSSTPDMLYYLE